MGRSVSDLGSNLKSEYRDTGISDNWVVLEVIEI